MTLCSNPLVCLELFVSLVSTAQQQTAEPECMERSMKEMINSIE